MDHLFKWLVIVRLYNSPFSSEKMFEFEHTNDWDYWSVYGKVLKTFLKDGFFHADLHGGNFFYLENGQIGLIDFGKFSIFFTGFLSFFCIGGFTSAKLYWLTFLVMVVNLE